MTSGALPCRPAPARSSRSHVRSTPASPRSRPARLVGGGRWTRHRRRARPPARRPLRWRSRPGASSTARWAATRSSSSPTSLTPAPRRPGRRPRRTRSNATVAGALNVPLTGALQLPTLARHQAGRGQPGRRRALGRLLLRRLGRGRQLRRRLGRRQQQRLPGRRRDRPRRLRARCAADHPGARRQCCRCPRRGQGQDRRRLRRSPRPHRVAPSCRSEPTTTASRA